MSESDGPTYDVNELTIYDFFEYWPHLSLAITALVLYTAAAAVIAFLTERRRNYRFMHLITATGLLEAGGYAALVYAIEMSGEGSVFNAYVAQQVLVIMAPNVIQASMYWQIGLVLAFSPLLTRGRKLLRGWIVTLIFACADLFAITVQAIGISIWATSQSSGDPDQDQIRLGCGITLAGLIIQIVAFAGFAVLVIWTHGHPNNGLAGKKETRKMFIGLYLAMIFLTIRNLFRLVEFAQATILTWPAPEGAYVLSEQQVLFYTLDTLPILLCFACYICCHPGYLLPAGGPKQQHQQQVAAKAADLEASTSSEQQQKPADSVASQEFKVSDLV